MLGFSVQACQPTFPQVPSPGARPPQLPQDALALLARAGHQCPGKCSRGMQYNCPAQCPCRKTPCAARSRSGSDNRAPRKKKIFELQTGEWAVCIHGLYRTHSTARALFCSRPLFPSRDRHGQANKPFIDRSRAQQGFARPSGRNTSSSLSMAPFRRNLIKVRPPASPLSLCALGGGRQQNQHGRGRVINSPVLCRCCRYCGRVLRLR